MRKFTFLLLALSMCVGVAVAQEAKKLVKTGSKALSKYVSDPTDTENYELALSSAADAVKAEPNNGAAWQLKGDVHAAELNNVAAKVRQLRADNALAAAGDAPAPKIDFSSIEYPQESASMALEAYQKAYQNSDKSAYKKQAITSMQTAAASMSDIGNAMLESDRYEDAYAPLAAMNEIDKFYVANGEEPLFQDDAARNQQKYIMAVVANQMGNRDAARMLFKELYEAEYPEAAVYAGYSGILTADGDEAGGVAVLSRGRELFPDNTEILFAEINYYIQKEDFKTLESKLQSAIAKEPNNVGLYTALGNVYMNLSKDEADAAREEEYMNKSVEYFNKATELDADNVDAIYSIGSMYFNKAVAKANEMNQLGTSKADQKRYDQLNGEITELFDQALPYFTKAEKIDPDDRNTLIALKEIYARKNDFEKSNEYKAKLGEG